MINREKLLQTNPYDMLLKMHEYMMNKAPSCVLEPLGKKCDKFRTCENCILQTSDNKPHGCEEEGYYLLHGYPEEER